MSPTPQKNKGSKKARLSAARLAAVQAVYQMELNDQPAPQVAEEFATHRLGQPMDGEMMVLPDGVLFNDIVKGMAEHRTTIDDMLRSALNKEDGGAKVDGLLRAILRCGAYELLVKQETDAPIIISDYLRVTHAFYAQGESKLVNGVLDKISKAVRPVL